MTYFKLIAFGLILISFDNSLSAQGLSSIEWGRPVAYSDFEAKPDKADTAAANISVTILLGYSKDRDGYLKFKVVAVMDKDESWIKDAFRIEAILRHEQGHFDIAHIFAKKLEANLKSRRYTSNDVNALNTLYDSFLEKMNVLQVKYDKETHGGLDAAAQARWKRFIQNEIAALERNNP